MEAKNRILTILQEKEIIRDKAGFIISTQYERTDIFAAVGSVARNEFYEAERTGIRVDISATVNEQDFIIVRDGKKTKPSLVELDGIKYKVIRTYRKDDDLVLTLQEVE